MKSEFHGTPFEAKRHLPTQNRYEFCYMARTRALVRARRADGAPVSANRDIATCTQRYFAR